MPAWEVSLRIRREVRGRGSARAIVAALLFTVVAGCGARDLSGKWELTLPAGYTYRSRIERIGADRYRIPGIVTLSGTYERRGDSLFVVEPEDPRLTEFVWRIQDLDHMVLVQSPPVAKIGSDYTGATLQRIE